MYFTIFCVSCGTFQLFFFLFIQFQFCCLLLDLNRCWFEKDLSPVPLRCLTGKKTHVLRRRNTILMQLVCTQLRSSQIRRETLAGHVPIELSGLLKNFLEASNENKLHAQVTGKRKREVGLVVPAKYTAFTTELRIARILERELNGRAVKYNHFELKNIAFDENKFLLLCLSCIFDIVVVLRNSPNKRRIGTAALVNFFASDAAVIRGQRLFE